MDIHVVQLGQTIYMIAQKYNVSVTRLIQDNELLTPNNLVTGQTIVILYPKETYTVLKGDTLISIAHAHDVTLMQLLRNNSYLSDREYIYPGETIVISYNNNKGKISTDGYAYPFMDKHILKKTLPFLTYLTIFNYRVIMDGEIIGDDDTEIIQIAKEYGVAPLMSLSSLTGQGAEDLAVVYSILLSPELQDRNIDNMLNILKTKGYYGLNISFQYMNAANQLLYENFITKITNRLHNEGYPVFVTINPRIIFNKNDITFGGVDYSGIGQAANHITFLSYFWGYALEPPIPTSFYMIRAFLNYAITMIPPENICIGLPIIGYQWHLPFEIGITIANSLSTNSAITLASEVDATIEYNENLQSPFFVYVENISGVPNEYIVWFKDARSVNAIINLVPAYGFKGVAIWNIMYYFAQLWLIINSQYEIEKVLPELNIT